MKIAISKEWYHWNQPYFRYNIYKEQQELLMNVYDAFGDRILIVYAAPTIQDINELVRIHYRGALIETQISKPRLN